MDCDAYRDDLMDVLYGEADPATARRFQEHQARCAACREEVASLRRVRRDLDGWVLAPRVASRVKPLLRPRYLAAAAAVLLSVTSGALVLAKGELRYPNGQVAFRVAAPAPEVAELRQLLREVARLVHESETRQSAAFAAGLNELADRTESQRRVDFAQMSAGLSLLESRTGLQAARTTELMGKVVLASQGK